MRVLALADKRPPVDPALMARLQDPAHEARVERGIVLHVEAIDWNCPQHITPRYTVEELAPALEKLQAEHEHRRAQLQLEIDDLRAQVRSLTGGAA